MQAIHRRMLRGLSSFFSIVIRLIHRGERGERGEKRREEKRKQDDMAKGWQGDLLRMRMRMRIAPPPLHLVIVSPCQAPPVSLSPPLLVSRLRALRVLRGESMEDRRITPSARSPLLQRALRGAEQSLEHHHRQHLVTMDASPDLTISSSGDSDPPRIAVGKGCPADSGLYASILSNGFKQRCCWSVIHGDRAYGAMLSVVPRYSPLDRAAMRGQLDW